MNNEKITVGEHSPAVIEREIEEVNAHLSNLMREFIRQQSSAAQYESEGADHGFKELADVAERNLRAAFESQLERLRLLAEKLGHLSRSENSAGLTQERFDTE